MTKQESEEAEPRGAEHAECQPAVVEEYDLTGSAGLTGAGGAAAAQGAVGAAAAESAAGEEDPFCDMIEGYSGSFWTAVSDVMIEEPDLMNWND